MTPIYADTIPLDSKSAGTLHECLPLLATYICIYIYVYIYIVSLCLSLSLSLSFSESLRLRLYQKYRRETNSIRESILVLILDTYSSWDTYHALTELSRDEDCCGGDVSGRRREGVVDCVPLCVEEVETSSTALEHTSMLQAHG